MDHIVTEIGGRNVAEADYKCYHVEVVTGYYIVARSGCNDLSFRAVKDGTTGL